MSFSPESKLSSVRWGGTTRISPSWPISFELDADQSKRNVDLASRPLTEETKLCFIGPASPAQMYNELQTELFSKLKLGDGWLTLGYYNFVFFLESDDEVSLLIDFCHRNDCRAEIWHVLDESDIADIRCDKIDYIDPTEDQTGPGASPYQPLVFEHPKLLKTSIDSIVKQAFQEFHALREICRFRANGKLKPLIADVARISDYLPTPDSIASFQEAYGTAPTENERERANIAALTFRDQILATNAGLTRQTSQALSGSPPLLQTECQFLPHSLLGTTTASLALRNLAHFIISSVNDANYNFAFEQRLAGNIDAVTPDNNELQPSGTETALFEGISLSSARPTADAEQHLTPSPITYFSARDGFRFGVFTNSAPLPCISGCNSKQWNLATISHELSHRIITPKIQRLLIETMPVAARNPDDTVKELCRKTVDTVADAARTLLINAITLREAMRLGPDRFESAVRDPTEFISNGITQNEHNIEERLVHIFDFYHFYSQDSEAYTSSIWQSWAVQPSIATKFEEYIERTAVALASRHFGAKNWIELTIEDFEQCSAKEHFWHQSLYREKLEAYIRANKEGIGVRLRRNWPLLALFFLVFRSKRLAELANRESRETSSAKALVLADDSGLEFPQFSNPLKVARNFGDGKIPDSGRSAWLLTLLAYGFVEQRSVEAA